MSLDSLFDTELDDLADLPSFAVPPAGSYIASIKKWEAKDVAGHPSWEITFNLKEVAELVNVNDVAPEPNSECSVLYMMDNDIGQGHYKEFAAPFAAAAQSGSPRVYVPASIGMEIMLTTKVRQNKEKTQDYLDVVSVHIL